MSDDELTQSIKALTPENLLSVFAALLLCQQAANHGDHRFPVDGGKLIDLLGDDLNIGHGIVSGLRHTESRKDTDIRLAIAG